MNSSGPNHRVPKDALRRIGELYAIEAEVTGKTTDERQMVRSEQALSMLTDLQTWLLEQRRRLSSRTGLAKAMQYALTRWDCLCLYTEDGRLGIDNNPAERSLRTIAISSKNFLFLGSNAGGTATGPRPFIDYIGPDSPIPGPPNFQAGSKVVALRQAIADKGATAVIRQRPQCPKDYPFQQTFLGTASSREMALQQAQTTSFRKFQNYMAVVALDKFSTTLE